MRVRRLPASVLPRIAGEAWVDPDRRAYLRDGIACVPVRDALGKCPSPGSSVSQTATISSADAGPMGMPVAATTVSMCMGCG